MKKKFIYICLIFSYLLCTPFLINENNKQVKNIDNEYLAFEDLENNILKPYELDEEELIEPNNLEEDIDAQDLEDSKKVIYVIDNDQTIGGVSYKKGSNSNNGLTPQTAVETIEKAYQLLDADKEETEQVIVIIGDYLRNISSKSEIVTSIANSTVFTKPATVTGKWDGVDYGGILKLIGGGGTGTSGTGTFLFADTIFENITLSATSSNGNIYIYCQGRDLVMGENIKYRNMGSTSTGSVDNGMVNGKSANFHLIAGWLSYDNNVPLTKDVTHITILSGSYSRILCGNRMGVAAAAKNVGHLPERPFNVDVVVDIKNEDASYDYSVNAIFGGQTEGSIYENLNLTIKNGRIGRICGGSIGNDVADGNRPGNTFFGSTTINIMGGSVKELYGASLGRSRVGYNRYDGSYQYGLITINISGGTIKSTIYGAGAGAVTGYKEDSTDMYKAYAYNTEMVGMDGTKFRLDQTKVEINISGGTIEGSVHGAGFGYTNLLKDYQVTNDGGALYGDVLINISGGTIKGSVYGAGKGSDGYGASKDKLANMYGNVEINITGNPTITGNVFGSGEGVENYPEMAKLNGNVKVNIDSDDFTLNGNIYGGAAIAQTKGDVDLDLRLKSVKNIYGGGNAGKIDGNINLNISAGKISGNVYGGGNAGDITGKTKVTISNATINEVYGGGNAGKVGVEFFLSDDEEIDLENKTTVIINSGTIRDVFGGGNIGEVVGNTFVQIGTDEGDTTITGIIYGGGRGLTSEFDTVDGDCTVNIVGVNTDVENYGSKDLGKVDGEVYLKFIDHYNNNPASKYKIMNGIDRATTVYFENSYVLLENIINGVLTGIDDIENIVLPKDSGLKISASSYLRGDFTGGGELYLDSGVALTVGGDLTNTTTLVINPINQKITGKIDNPYIIVKGDSEANDTEATAVRIIGTNFNILTQKSDLTNNDTYYYLKNDIYIDDYITDTTVNVIERVYNGLIENNHDIAITSKDIFTSKKVIEYNFFDDKTKGDKYKKISKFISISGINDEISLPVGTRIVMISPDKQYYYYKVEESIEHIDLGLFKNMINDENYVNLFDLTTITDPAYVDTNQTTGNKTYKYSEEYRFIIDFCDTNNSIKEGTFYLKMTLLEPTFDTYIEDSNIKTNLVTIYKRDLYIQNETVNNVLLDNGSMNFTGKIYAGNFEEIDYTYHKNINTHIYLKNQNEEDIILPHGTRIIVNGIEYESYNGMADLRLLTNVDVLSQFEIHYNFTLDFSKVLPSERLKPGTYELLMDLYEADNKISDQQSFGTVESDFVVEKSSGEYGFKVELYPDTHIPEDKRYEDRTKYITFNKKEERTIRVDYTGELVGAKVKLEAVEKYNKNEYKVTLNSNNKISISESLFNITNNTVDKDILLTFKEGLQEGTYRIKVDLLDLHDRIIDQDYINFIVVE